MLDNVKNTIALLRIKEIQSPQIISVSENKFHQFLNNLKRLRMHIISSTLVDA